MVRTGAKISGLSSKTPTTRHFCVPVGTVISKVSPVVRSCSSAQSLSTRTVSSARSVAAAGVHRQLEAGRCVSGAGGDHEVRRRRNRPKPNRSRSTDSTPSIVGHPVGDRRRVALAEGAADDVVTDEVLLDGLVHRRLRRGAEDGDGEGQGEPDHQRRRGGGRTPRVAQRVLPGQPTDRAEERRVDRTGRRAGTAGRSPGWPRSRPAARPARRRRPTTRCAGPPPTKRPTSDQRDARARSARCPSSSRRRTDDSGSATSSRSAWTGAIRPVRRAGSQAATIVTTMPVAYAATACGARRSAAVRPGRGRTVATRDRMPIASTHAEPEPERGADDADRRTPRAGPSGSPGASTRPARAAGRARGCAGRPGSRRC